MNAIVVGHTLRRCHVESHLLIITLVNRGSCVVVRHSGYPPDQSASVASLTESLSEQSDEMPADPMARRPCPPSGLTAPHTDTSPGTRLGSENTRVSLCETYRQTGR